LPSTFATLRPTAYMKTGNMYCHHYKKETFPRYETFVIYRELCLRYKEIFRQQKLEEFLVGNFPHDRYGNVPRNIEPPVMN
jgi:hypothetical protein